MKSMLLGTAQWGWSVSRAEAFVLLDQWLKAGYSEVDCATNYPINRRPDDFKAAEKILTEYIQAHGLQNQLRITMKVGSMDNMRTPDINLSPSFILMVAHEYRRILGDNLSGIMLHWDNRDDPDAIAQSIEALQILQKEGLRPGLSGIRHPDIYAQVCAPFQLNFDVEVKHNVFQSDLNRYKPLFFIPGTQHRTLAYGLNAGGIKFSGQRGSEMQTFALRGGDPALFVQALERIEAALPDWAIAFVRPPIVTMNHLGMVYALCNPAIQGAVIGPRTPAQMREAITWHRNTQTFDYTDVLRYCAGIAVL